MNLVKGKNVAVMFFEDDEWKLYACARACTLATTTDLIDVTVTGSGKYKSFEPTVNSFAGNIDGLVNLDDDGSTLSLADLRERQLAHQKLKVMYQRIAEDGTTYSEEAFFYITSVTDTSSFDNINTFTVELQGTGAITQMFCPMPQNVFIDTITNDSATVHWDNYGNAAGYVVVVNGNSQAGGSSPRVLVGLESNTVYTIQVITQCLGDLGSSTPSVDVIFETL